MYVSPIRAHIGSIQGTRAIFFYQIASSSALREIESDGASDVRTARLCEQRVDLLPFTPRRHIASILAISRATSRAAFVDRTRGRSLRRETALKFAGVAVLFAGAIKQCCPIIHESGGRGQLHAGWADVSVALSIVGEVFRETLPSARAGFIEHRNVRLDRPLVYQPTQHLR